MKLHSVVDNITNSSSTTYIFPSEGAEKTVIDLFNLISAIIKEKFSLDVDLGSILEAKVIPSEDWVNEQRSEREYEINELAEKREKCSNLTDSEFEHFYGNEIMSDEEFVEFITDPQNTLNDDDIPNTDLKIELGGQDISGYFYLYEYYNDSEG